MKTRLAFTSLALIALLALAGCGKPATPPATAASAASGAAPVAARTCCQCPGVWNEPPTTPRTYRLDPACSTQPSAGTCNTYCTSQGYPSGALAAGSCVPASAPGVGNLCY